MAPMADWLADCPAPRNVALADNTLCIHHHYYSKSFHSKFYFSFYFLRVLYSKVHVEVVWKYSNLNFSPCTNYLMAFPECVYLGKNKLDFFLK